MLFRREDRKNMAESLYNKYRPQTFEEVVGQEHVEKTLMNAVEAGKPSHAYLFCGPRGTGKTTTARLLAKALLCKKAPTPEPDGTCAQCLEIAEGNHPDVYELDAASRAGVDNIREEIISRVKFAPTRGAYKIYIIDEVHALSSAAFQALLRTIEEPPSHIIFVLCTTEAHKVPDTISSRCQCFEFKRLNETQIVSRLADICEREGFAVEPGALELIALRSQGGMRDAISALEQVAVFSNGQIDYEAAEGMLGAVTLAQLFTLADLVASRDATGCFSWVAEFVQGATDVALFVNEFAGHIRNLYAACLVKDKTELAAILSCDEDTFERYRMQARRFGSVDRLAHVLAVLGDLSKELKSAPNARLALEIALTRMVRPASDLSLEALAARIAVLEQGAPLSPALVGEAIGGSASEGPNGGAVGSERLSPTNPSLEPVVLSASEGPSGGAVGSERLCHPGPDPGPIRVVVGSERLSSNDPVDFVAAPSSTNHVGSFGSNAPVAPSGASPAGTYRLWLQVEAELKKQSRLFGTLLSGAEAQLDAENGKLLIVLPGDAGFTKMKLEDQANIDLMKAAISRIFGKDYQPVYSLGSSAVSTTEPYRESRQAQDKSIIEGIFSAASTSNNSNKPGVKGAPVIEESKDAVDTADAADTADTGGAKDAFAQAPTNEKSDKTLFEDMLSLSFGSTITLEEI